MMEVLSSSSYPSGTSGDSLKEAFASLDAASLERREYSLGSLDSLSSILRGPAAGQQWRHYSASQHSPTLLKARRRQDGDNQSTALRPLCGGRTLEEMEREVERRAAIDRSSRAQRHTQSRDYTNQASTSTAAYRGNSAGPSFQAFPMSMAADESFGEELNTLSEEISTPGAHEPEREDLEGSSPLDDTVGVALTASEPSASQATKKRTMQWAAKRDRRIARRRDAPPLTRSQARQRGTQGNMAEAVENEISRPSTGSHDITAEITDPSIGGDDQPEMVEEVPPAPRRQKRKKKDVPALPLTYTEPEEAIKAPMNRESGESSMTQSDSGQPAGVINQVKGKAAASRYGAAGPAPLADLEVDSSDTEEEEEQQQPAPQAMKKRQTRPMPDLEKSSRKKAKTGDATKGKALKAALVPKVKIASNKVQKGSTIFEGLRFLLFGFWSQVKLFEKLIEKHGGIVCKAKTYPEIDDANKIDYILSCTHSGHKPRPNEMTRWKGQLAGVEAEHLSQVTLLFNTTPMIQADWISECIAKCLRKEDLLSVERHRISVA